MNIFISHSLADKELLKSIESNLKPHGLTLFIAEHFEDVEKTITEKIESMINNCHLALILLTENGYNSHFVQQEIGYIRSKGKPYLQIVQKGFQNKIKGFNYGKGYILIDPSNPTAAIARAKEIIMDYWNKLYEKEQRELAQYQQQLEAQRKKEESDKAIATVALVSLIFLAIGSSSKK